MPGVSRNTICASGRVTTPCMAARVVCGFSETMESLLPTSRLSSVDLPAFGRPTIDTNPDLCFGALLVNLSFDNSSPQFVGRSPWTAPDALVRLVWRLTRPEQGLGPRARAPALPLGRLRYAHLVHAHVVPRQHFDANALAFHRF